MYYKYLVVNITLFVHLNTQVEASYVASVYCHAVDYSNSGRCPQVLGLHTEHGSYRRIKSSTFVFCVLRLLQHLLR